MVKQDKQQKMEKPFYKKSWVWIVAIIVVVKTCFGGNDTSKDTQKESKPAATQEAKEIQTEKKEPGKIIEGTTKDDTKAEDDVPNEYKSALKKAELCAKTLNMSKRAIFEQLTSEYGEKFSKEASEYAISKLEYDWKAFALKKAETYSKTMHKSKQGIYEQLISEHGEKFTEEEAQYAIDNLKADYNKNALAKAKNYQESMNMSPEAIRDQLTSEYGEKFTQEEADYAIEHLDK